MDDEQPERIEAAFRSGSLTAISVVLGFSLSFLSRWAGLPGNWHRLDLVAVVGIVLGIACQVKSLGDLLHVRSLLRAPYERAVRVFLVGLALVAFGVALAIFGDLTGLGQHILGG